MTSYGIGVANNGGGTDGEEYVFPEGSATAGTHILLARSPEAMASFGMTGFDVVLEATSSISQNGNDAIELYFGGSVIEVFGDPEVDPDTFGDGCQGDPNCWDYEDAGI